MAKVDHLNEKRLLLLTKLEKLKSSPSNPKYQLIFKMITIVLILLGLSPKLFLGKQGSDPSENQIYFLFLLTGLLLFIVFGIYYLRMWWLKRQLKKVELIINQQNIN